MMRCGLLLAAACAASGLSLSPATDEVIQNEYIVLLHKNITAGDHDALNARVKGRKFSIGKSFRAVHATLLESELEWVLGQDHLVQSVEHNQVVRVAAENPGSCPSEQTTSVSWGQVRTTSTGPTALDDFRYNAKWGEDTDVYIIDTGIRCTHVDFKDPAGASRCLWGTNTAGGSNTDVNGHGTHCASTAAGLNYGIAKAATLIAVKVLGDNGSGSTAGVIAGVEWAVTNSKSRGKRSVGNMSLGGGFSTASNNAVDAAVDEGVLMAVAAGNDNRDASNYSPASAPKPITVGSTELASSGGTQLDARSSFSNYGATLNVFAPGSSIVAAYATSDTAYATLSGTSMASPHVAGVLAAGLSMQQVISGATSNVVSNIGAGSPNLMLHLQCSS